MATINEARETLDRLLLKFPAMEQTDPVQLLTDIRFTIQLRTHPPGQAARIFVFLTSAELEQGTSATLESLFRARITRTSFPDAATGALIHTSVSKLGEIGWAAIDIESWQWVFSENQKGGWVKEGFRVPVVR